MNYYIDYQMWKLKYGLIVLAFAIAGVVLGYLIYKIWEVVFGGKIIVLRKYKCEAVESDKHVVHIERFFTERSMRIWGGKKKRGKWCYISYWKYNPEKEKWEGTV